MATVGDPAVDGREDAIGRLLPAGEGLAQARWAVSCIGTALFGATAQVHWMVDHIAIRLSWMAADVDLDLHVTTPDGACGYRSPTGLAEVEFQEDNLGKGPGPHHEHMKILPSASERFDLFVRAHDGVAAVRQARAEATLSWRHGGQPHSRIVSLFDASAQDWHVATFVRGSDAPVIVDRPARDFMPGRPWAPGE